MDRKRIRLSDQVRRAVDDSGLSRRSICKAVRLDEGYFSRFMGGKGGLGAAYMDALADLLRLAIVPSGKSRKRLRLSEQVRQVVADSGFTRNAIHRLTGVSHETLTAFLARKTGLRTAKLDDLADFFQLDIVRTGKPPTIPRGKPGRPRKTT